MKMRHGIVARSALLIASLLTGCVMPFGQGDPTTRFEQILASNPNRVDALVGLGIARYKEGLFNDAVEHLSRAVAREPKHYAARLYLALAYLRKGEDGRAEEHLNALSSLKPDPRVAAQIDRTLRILRQSLPPNDEMRSFIAASLEDGVEMAREVQDAKRAQQTLERNPFVPRDCFITKDRRIICF